MNIDEYRVTALKYRINIINNDELSYSEFDLEIIRLLHRAQLYQN